jgi:hypothetical protein
MSFFFLMSNKPCVSHDQFFADGTFDLDGDGPKRAAGGGRDGKRVDSRGGGKAGRGSDSPQKSFKRQAKDAK